MDSPTYYKEKDEKNVAAHVTTKQVDTAAELSAGADVSPEDAARIRYTIL